MLAGDGPAGAPGLSSAMAASSLTIGGG